MSLNRNSMASLLLAGAGLICVGCADMTYDGIRLGQPLREYERAMPEEKTRRTESTVTYADQDWSGRTDAVVLVLTRDRRVAGKLQASYAERWTGLQTETVYALRGEIDPNLAKLNSTGPADTLRAIADQLLELNGDQVAREAHGWVAAGLVRLLQRWPHVGDEGPAFPRMPELMERVPADGTARLSVNPQGVFLVEYFRGALR